MINEMTELLTIRRQLIDIHIQIDFDITLHITIFHLSFLITNG